VQGRARGVYFLVFFVLYLAPCVLRPVVWAAQIYPKASKKQEPLKPLTAQTLLTQLDRLEDEDQQLLQAMGEIQSEMAIIKTRAAVPKRVINQLSSGTECP